jgi:hypothetical protein
MGRSTFWSGMIMIRDCVEKYFQLRSAQFALKARLALGEAG